MSKEYYKKQIIDLRASIAKEREAKKKDNEYYARLIKGTSSTDTKARYRKSKVEIKLLPMIGLLSPLRSVFLVLRILLSVVNSSS